jgi:hypothetical protein
MSNVALFKQDVPDFLKSATGLNDLTKALAGNMASGSKRISIRGGVFRKIVGGEEVGKITGRELNVIIVNANKNVSRIFYAGKYNPTEIVPPTCQSTDGLTPEAGIEDKQAALCSACPQNIAGSGEGNSRACKYQRRLAILLEGDTSGDVYQLTIPATSIFGKGEGNLHPFESYIKYIAGNGRNINQIITQISLDTDSDTPKLLFSPARHVNQEEWGLSEDAGSSLAARNAVTMSVAQTDGVKKPKAVEYKGPILKAFKAEPQSEPEESAEILEPVKRVAKKPDVPAADKKNLADVINAWGDE